jgi:hypothetical protein
VTRSILAERDEDVLDLRWVARANEHADGDQHGYSPMWSVDKEPNGNSWLSSLATSTLASRSGATDGVRAEHTRDTRRQGNLNASSA